MNAYAELQLTTNFSFLRGASHPHELVETAKVLGHGAIAVTDRNSLAGAVRMHDAARKQGLRLVVGCRLDLEEDMSVLCYPMDRSAYSRLTRLLTLGKRRAEKGACKLTLDDLAAHGAGQIVVALGDAADDGYRERLHRLKEIFADRLYLALTRRFRPDETLRLDALFALAQSLDIPTVATNDVLYHDPGRRMLQDTVTCIRHTCTIDELGFRRERSADRFLKDPEEMARLFPRHADAVARTLEIVARCRFSLDELRYQYPDEVLIPGKTAQEALEHLTWTGAGDRYGGSVPDKVRNQLRHELGLIARLDYAPYFLTVWRIVAFAKGEGILCQGRGSAANSAVCYCLGITDIDPGKTALLFERFISAERNEPPDIDVDFEHERREEVIQWIYQTYGRERAAMTATVNCYRTRGALREVGKAMGLPEDVTAALAKSIWGWSMEGMEETRAREIGLDPDDPRLRLTLDLTRQLVGFPRHLSQHPGGFVITRDRLDDLVPIGNAAMEDRTVIEWDKDDIATLRMMKVDVLGLGMLGCLRRAFDLLREHKNMDLTVATLPQNDTKVYDMLCRADTVGVFQVESRAQMNMLPRLRPRCYYDLVIEVAIVRPGPIQGDMVHPYLRRRDGKEKIEYPSSELEDVLKRTLGVPLFQEQAMQIAVVAAGFTPGEADELRRAMASFRNMGTIAKFEIRFIDGMVARGYDRVFAERCFNQIAGFGDYGFPESHAASFALLVYASSWIKCHHPEIFLAAILNAQPMGFYAPAQLIDDARRHGVPVLPVDVNHSHWEATLEHVKTGLAVRLGFRGVKGLSNAAVSTIVAARHRPYASVADLFERSGIPLRQIEILAEADAFQSMGVSRRKAVWAIRALDDDPLPLFRAAGEDLFPEPEVLLKPMTDGGAVVEDYASVGFSLRAHPLAFIRDDLSRLNWKPTASLLKTANEHQTRVAGLVLVRQRPGSAKGVLFITLEDETGIANAVVWPDFFETFRPVIMTARLLGIVGRVQREGEVIHVVAKELIDLSSMLLDVGDRNFPANGGAENTAAVGADPQQSRIKVISRDFR